MITYKLVESSSENKFHLVIEFPSNDYGAETYNLILQLLNFADARASCVLLHARGKDKHIGAI